MKFLLLLVLMLPLVSQAAVPTSYTIGLGPKFKSALVLQQRNISGKQVYTLTYFDSSAAQRAERVLPKSEFLNSVKEFKAWRKNLALRQSSQAGPFCDEKVLLSERPGDLPLCLSGIAKAEKAKYFRWVRAQTNLVTGRL